MEMVMVAAVVSIQTMCFSGVRESESINLISIDGPGEQVYQRRCSSGFNKWKLITLQVLCISILTAWRGVKLMQLRDVLEVTAISNNVE